MATTIEDCHPCNSDDCYALFLFCFQHHDDAVAVVVLVEMSAILDVLLLLGLVRCVVVGVTSWWSGGWDAIMRILMMRRECCEISNWDELSYCVVQCRRRRWWAFWFWKKSKLSQSNPQRADWSQNQKCTTTIQTRKVWVVCAFTTLPVHLTRITILRFDLSTIIPPLQDK